ncbi:MAG: hypothetical protein COA69_12565 [Robiginitomaculum sp.]|nr:MAG: hypothetical protein COA69_12565 [Robiginitomaculum sp.]
MLDLMNGFMAEIAKGPLWVQYWVNFLGLMLMLSIPFSFVRKEARWVLLSMLIVMPLMMLAYQYWGFEKILGIVHVVIWGPLMVYLWKRRQDWHVRQTISGKWLVVLFCTIAVSLIFDVADVARYLLGHRA